jgi:trehalose synthase
MIQMVCFLLPFALFAGSMLSDAESMGKKYAPTLAKNPSPSASPQIQPLLDKASIWLSIDLRALSIPKNQTALQILGQENFWQILSEIGVEGLYLEGLKTGGAFQTELGINPQWGGSDWPSFSRQAQKWGIALIGDAVGTATGIGPDFEMALKKIGDYAGLYHLIEIDPADWSLLPSPPAGSMASNISWLAIQELSKKGYISEKNTSYTKKSHWNATKKIEGADGVWRRWIYLKQNQNDPLLTWLSPSFAANRLASGDSLYRMYELGQKISCVEASLPFIAKETQLLWIRKIGGFSVQTNNRTLKDLKENHCDAATDTLTRSALLHALIAEDAQMLRLIYRLFLDAKIEQARLVHVLQPFDPFACEWTEFALNPKKNYAYFEEQITGELLRQKLLKEDLLQLNGSPLSTWSGYCALAPSAACIQDFEKKKEAIQKTHQLLALAYAMQPGIFSFSAADLLGALPEEAKELHLLEANPKTLYPSLALQLQNPHSFASFMRKILALRKKSNISKAELIAVPQTTHPGSLLLVYRLPKSRFIQLLALNFGQEMADEKVDIEAIQHTLSLELLSSLTQEKVFDSSTFRFQLPPLSGKVFLFQPKYFD